jgi:hypothetical protein
MDSINFIVASEGVVAPRFTATHKIGAHHALIIDPRLFNV